MPQQIELPPDPHLLESMRAVGYTAETAVADLIDNSITADARVVDILSSAAGPPRLSILDDGTGMDRETALSALRLAARSPGDKRDSHDLGRFGLGLKTASISQARILTVVTKRDGITTALRWDLDHVTNSGTWSVLEVPEEAYEGLLGWEQFEALPHGTLVAWENLDLFQLTEGTSQADFDRAISRVQSHCQLVFHRFVTGDGVRKVALRFNSSDVTALDPFLRSNRATQVKKETIRLDGKPLTVQAFTLPYLNKMTAKEKTIAGVAGSLRDSQGFYIYRAGRLVIWGTWFRLNPKSEMGKLARVQVDIPNSLDHLWALDIKKSQATPPREIASALRNLATQMIVPSTRVQTFRGRKLKSEDPLVRLWDVVAERDSEFRYEINRDHPVISGLTNSLDTAQLAEVSALLTLVEQTFPVIDAHNRLSRDQVSRQDDAELDRLVAHALALRPTFADTHPDDDDFIRMILGVEPYGSQSGFEAQLRKKLG